METEKRGPVWDMKSTGWTNMVVMDDLPGKTAVKGKVGNDPSDCSGGGEGGAAGKGLAQPVPPNSWCALMSPRHFLPPNGGV